MSNSYFQFKQFIIHQDKCAMKVTTDSCLFGAWVSNEVKSMRPEIQSVFDIGTGTGLLSLMLAQNNHHLQVDAVEIDKETFEQATENINKSPWSKLVTIYQADAKEFLPTHLFDIIISNPPFYENELKSEKIQKNIAHHSEALSMNDLLLIIKKNLKPDGMFYLLLPYKRNATIKNLLSEHGFSINKMMYVRQSEQHDFFRIMIAGKIKGTKNEVANITNELSIRDNKQDYTTAFTELLKDYYLHL